ncbi:MAG TPA: bifunctional diaminohydroxyphosphoribosylaminopyrimidine deaminase/5-amino-6-(5-phosphoribosylamino)uracil reductase RibD [Chitinophagaceae bacterium]|nr:bifunctional diaminohydroxyphosphoribosylaminopyrimidine deaminase/5-amino-6-(5-phosphoribosylamino)uracil reductase RibD [Chitinophagaceae bacterium]
MADDEQLMSRCIQLAANVRGLVAPNPMVGAVLVHEGRIIAEGYHREFGEAHAEADCLRRAELSAKELIRASTLYVNLEPCSHQGKTPPCADLILDHGIPEVVIGTQDPFELVQGRGIRKLEAGGIRVRSGILAQACRDLNIRFFTFHEKKRPYLILKWARSRDGFIAGKEGSPVKLTRSLTDRLVHKWRSEEAAILIGAKTLWADQPRLTNRLWTGPSPVRVVLGRNPEFPQGSPLLDGNPRTLVFNSEKSGSADGVEFIRIREGIAPLGQLLVGLHHRAIQSVLVEGGAELLGMFLRERCWDEARVITTPVWMGEGIREPVLKGSRVVREYDLEGDRITEFAPA